MIELCARPHTRTIDYDASRFVVSKECGLDTDAGHLEYGDEVPRGLLSANALRQVYEPPLSRIELLEYAVTIPDLREACARRGVKLQDDPEPELAAKPDFNAMDKKDLIAYCQQNRIPFDKKDDATKLRKRLAAAALV